MFSGFFSTAGEAEVGESMTSTDVPATASALVATVGVAGCEELSPMLRVLDFLRL